MLPPLRRLTLALATVAMTLLAAPARAEFLDGTISVGAKAVTIDTNSVLTATVFEFSTRQGLDTQELTNGTGDFAAIPDFTIIGSTRLDLNSAAPLVLVLGANTFTADTVLADTPGTLPNTRTILLDGLIVDGPLFQPTRARMTLSFNQVGGPGTSVGYGGSIVTTSAVPEPASLAMLGTGALGLLSYARRRKARATA